VKLKFTFGCAFLKAASRSFPALRKDAAANTFTSPETEPAAEESAEALDEELALEPHPASVREAASAAPTPTALREFFIRVLPSRLDELK
jgi:hypothetical protein